VQLDSDRPFPERAAAVDKICKILEEYPVQNVLGLWSVASDLLLPEQPDHVAEAGYKLLKSCVSWPKLSTIERSILFDAASLRKNDRHFDLRLGVINALTKRGRDIEACESAIVPFITSSLETCYAASHEAANVNRKANGKRSADNPTLEADNLARMFQYAIDICKFNAKILSDKDLELLLDRAMVICLRTTQASDMGNCIKLFDTVLTYVHIPAQALRPCVEVLCTIHKLVRPLREPTWNSLSNLFKSHVGGAAVLSLLHTLLYGPTRQDQDKNPHKFYKGTLQVLRLLLLDEGRSGFPPVPVALLCPALKASITVPDPSQEELVIRLIDTVLAQDNLRDHLLGEIDVSELIAIVNTCVERDDDRHRANGVGETLPTNAESRERPHHENGTQNDDELSQASQDPANGHLGIAPDAVEPASKPDFARRSAEDPIFQLFVKLDTASDAFDFVQKEAVMELFLRFSHRLSDSATEKLIRHYANERYLNPAHSDWLKVCRTIVNSIVKDVTRPRSLRIVAIQAIRETYDTVDKLCASGQVSQCGALLLDNIQMEADVEILHELVDFAVHVADRASTAEFMSVVKLLQARLDRPRQSTTTNSTHWPSYSLLLKGDTRFGSSCNVIATAFVRLFIRSVSGSAQKTRILYETLRAIAGGERYDNDARLTSLKLLFRLRADSRHALSVSASSEGERIAAELCRTEETAVVVGVIDETLASEQNKTEDSASWREQRKTSGSSPHSSLNRHTGRTTAPAGRVSKPIPPLWMYPGPKGLPEKPSAESSRVVFSHIDASKYPLDDDVLDMEITLWLELIISLLQRPPDWEIYSYVLVHLGPQLSNQALVRSCVVQLRMLRNVLCEQVRNSSFHEPPVHTLLKKADVAVCLFHVLTVIISYHEYFEKSEEDDLVKAFLQGIVQWDRTSTWCIHALSVCCFEVPLSVSKSLDSIVQKLSQIVTKPATAIHILEFLTSLARLPELYKNFREDEFKLVFGVCFRYLQHIRDQRDRVAHTASLQSGLRGLRHSGASRDFAASPDHSPRRVKLIEDDLPQYLYSLAYHVITFWFMALKMEDRPKQMPWIIRNLYYTDASGRQIMEEQGQVIMDIMNMVGYTDRDQTLRDENFAKPGDGEIWKKTWVVGNSLVSIETAARTGVSLITTRRPVSDSRDTLCGYLN
tara:strand:+ start:5922 stop:9419 length:3498 start_codon:yes stop_codon:yes gene_type:complete